MDFYLINPANIDCTFENFKKQLETNYIICDLAVMTDGGTSCHEESGCRWNLFPNLWTQPLMSAKEAAMQK